MEKLFERAYKYYINHTSISIKDLCKKYHLNQRLFTKYLKAKPKGSLKKETKIINDDNGKYMYLKDSEYIHEIYIKDNRICYHKLIPNISN